MLRDSARIQEEDAAYEQRKRYRSRDHVPGPLYTEDDARHVAKLFEPQPMHDWQDLVPGVRLRFLHAGHILGAAISELELQDQGQIRRVVFTGDLGRRHQPVLMDPETIERCDVLICESTYANRQHPDTSNVSAELQRIICRAAEVGGRVIIPAFSLGRTQMLAYLLNELRNRDQLCRVPVFIDSPLATRLTDVHRLHTADMDSDVQTSLQQDDDVFSFPGLTYVRTQDESMALNRTPGPMVIIAAGGMCENGRIVHHLKHALDDERNTVMIIGFQAEHTLGRRLVERRPEVSIFGRRIPLRARVEVVNGLSAHADADDFRWWFGALQRRGGTGETYIVHGEAEAARALADIAADCSDELPVIPQYGQSFVIE
jgi:metallo-beta-lactamase family protein